jgi:ubiquinone biosynthesis UbiH/UbiF/VisC/COQ6 family hydroxylase
MTDAPIFIAGHGNAAKITALSLAAAGFSTRIDPIAPAPSDPASQPMPDWQNVLALSPAARTMLETLGVWAKLDTPSAPVTNMQVHGTKAQKRAGLLSQKLTFADPPQADNEVEVMAHIVSLASLARAIEAQYQALIENHMCQILPHAITAHHPGERKITLADGTTQTSAMLVDHTRGEKPWRRDTPRLLHDYGVTALTAELTCDAPHGGCAQQIFARTGTLALLPLPDAHRCALIWSLPHQQAAALKKAGADILAYEVNHATSQQFGTFAVAGPVASQPLSMRLARDFVAPGLVLLGDSAHITHPLAGQGFNLSLRDAAELADTVFEARGLGLSLDDFALLEGYQAKRRSDATLTISTTHSLNALFTSNQPWVRGLAGLGMGLTDALGGRFPGLKKQFRAQANHGPDTPPRLMRGIGFRD